MANTPSPQDGAPKASPAPVPELPRPPPKQNPAFRMLGMPNLRMKLPSRNWLIFLSITGSFAAAVTYDRRQKKAAQKKWCDAVSHISRQPLETRQMPRKLTIFMAAPPGDSIRPSRVYFKEYIKPILVAAAMDYEIIDGRSEGEVRYGTAEHVRKARRRLGETGTAATEDPVNFEYMINAVRETMNIQPEPVVKGDLVIGRHTWKEYVRGMHEGWLGPLDDPALFVQPDVEIIPEQPKGNELSETQSDGSQPTTDPSIEVAQIEQLISTEDPKPESPAEEKPKPPFPPPSYISTSAYGSSQLSPFLPPQLEPSTAIPHRHILGFFNTPIRLYRFLNQRHLADSIGRETAAIVLGLHRPYQQDQSPTSSITTGDTSSLGSLDASPTLDGITEAIPQGASGWEQQSSLEIEEGDWHKSARQPLRKDERERERVWLDGIVIESRIAERMRRFELSAEDEARATNMALAGGEKDPAGGSWFSKFL